MCANICKRLSEIDAYGNATAGTRVWSMCLNVPIWCMDIKSSQVTFIYIALFTIQYRLYQSSFTVIITWF